MSDASKRQNWIQIKEESYSPGATQIHPETANNRENDHLGGDLHGEILLQRYDGHAQRNNLRGHHGATRGRFRGLFHRPERDNRDRLQSADPERAHLRRGVLSARQEQPSASGLLEEAPRERPDAEQHMRRTGDQDCRTPSHPAHTAAGVRRPPEQYLSRAYAAPAAQEHEARQTRPESHHQSQSAPAGESGHERHRDFEEGTQSSPGHGRAEGLTLGDGAADELILAASRLESRNCRSSKYQYFETKFSLSI